ncbi:MAG: hypothetical protein M5U19_16070 [Microthrixaceae bacterium]|nr:hypothetical protein [Microthrixaceae bacterium]
MLVGTAAAVGAGGTGSGLSGVTWWRFVAAMAVALFVQVGTNFANDYSDGTRGWTIQVSDWAPGVLWAMGLRALQRYAGRC